MANTKQDVIKFLKVRDVKSPNRAHQFDAGIDFFVPKFNAEFIKDLKEKNHSVFYPNDDSGSYTINTGSLIMSSGIVSVGTSPDPEVKYELTDSNDTLIMYDEEAGKNYFNLVPHSRIMIPAGIKSRMATPGRALIASNKSGVATKKGLVFGAQVVDYTYKGEIHLSLINTSTKLVRIYEDMKIIQFVETPVFFSSVEVINDDDELDTETVFYEGLQDDRGEGGFGSTDNKK